MPAQVRFGAVLGLVAAVGVAAAAQSQPANTLRVDLYAVRDAAAVDDLRQDEVQLLEDGIPQTIESFERVAVAPGSPRSRVFVVFVDTYHTAIEDEPSARLPLVRMLDRLIERDDLVALSTPSWRLAISRSGRKAEVLSDLMQADWAWARRGRRRAPGSKEVLYDQCFDSTRAADRARGAEMKARWREETTLAALDDLVEHLGTLREERKAVLTISDGWQLFTASRTLGEPDDDKSSRSDRLRRFGDRGSVQGSPATPVMRVECEADRRRLAMVDNSQHLRDLTEAANRANVSFYRLYAPEVTVPVEGASRAVPQIEHAAARVDSLRLLADGTDGLAVLKRTAVDEALPRIVADESSYYLVTYRSSNAKLDGRFRTLSARVTRPGVKVRTRRGYRGLTTDELLSARRPAGAGRGTVGDPGGVDGRAPPVPNPHLVVERGRGRHVLDRGELDFRTRQELEWTAGATADVTGAGRRWHAAAVADPDGETRRRRLRRARARARRRDAWRVRGAGAVAPRRQRQRRAHRHRPRGDDRTARGRARHAGGVAPRALDRPASSADGRCALLAQRTDSPRARHHRPGHRRGPVAGSRGTAAAGAGAGQRAA
jgi:VWFA-related protein